MTLCSSFYSADGQDLGYKFVKAKPSSFIQDAHLVRCLECMGPVLFQVLVRYGFDNANQEI